MMQPLPRLPAIMVIGLLLVLLGLGNLIFGIRGEIEYEQLLSKAPPKPQPLCLDCLENQDELLDENSAIPVLAPPADGPYTDEMKARYDFYSFVVSGGFLLAGMGIVLILIGYQTSRRMAKEEALGEPR